MIQTELAAEAIRHVRPGIRVEIVPLVTTGDRILDRALLGVGGKGAFVTEFENALLEGRIDAAVHSAKDMPAELMEGLSIAAVLPREDPRDVLVTVKRQNIRYVPTVIGTGSLRRQVQIRERIPGAVCRLLRGNVNTRLKKLKSGEYDGIILAAAGLKRLGLLDDPGYSFEYLPEQEFIPAGGQGIIAVEGRNGSEFAELFDKINDKTAEISLRAEREVLRLLGAGCNEAVGVFSSCENDGFRIRLMKQTETGIVRREVSGSVENYGKLAAELVEGLSDAEK